MAKKRNFKNENIIILVLVIVLISSILTSGFGFSKLVQRLNAKRVANKTIDYINKNLLPEGVKASLISASATSNGLYSIKFKIMEREYDSYVSSDGKLLFPESIPLKETAKKADSTSEIPKKDKADVKLFVMSFCPYGNEAEEIMKPVVDLLKNKANIEVHYIVSKEGTNYTSLHGEQELNQDVREICVLKYQPEKFWDFILTINKKANSEDVDKKWEEIAKEVGIDIQKIKDCASKEKNSLLDAEIKLTDKYGVSGSPTLVINDTVYNGQRTTNSYKDAICAGFKNQPAECKTKLSDEQKSSSSGGCGQ